MESELHRVLAMRIEGWANIGCLPSPSSAGMRTVLTVSTVK